MPIVCCSIIQKSNQITINVRLIISHILVPVNLQPLRWPAILPVKCVSLFLYRIDPIPSLSSLPLMASQYMHGSMIDCTIECLRTVIMREFAGAIIGSDGCERSQITFPLNQSWIVVTSIEILYWSTTINTLLCFAPIHRVFTFDELCFYVRNFGKQCICHM